MHSHKNHVFGRDYITITRRINGRVDAGHLTAATPEKFFKSFGSVTNRGGKLQGQEIVGNERDLEARLSCKSESARASRDLRFTIAPAARRACTTNHI